MNWVYHRWKMLTRAGVTGRDTGVDAGGLGAHFNTAVIGYGLEARLTAWGIEAPKQRGVDYGKVLTTGGIAFLVNLSMSVIVAILAA